VIMLTKEQIETARHELPMALGRESIAAVNALCDLALKALEMRPRPLAEIDKAETALVIERDQHSKSLNVFVLNCYGSGHWKRSPASQAWLPSTLAIPLSAIPKESRT
jgi:hypothetical protein